MRSRYASGQIHFNSGAACHIRALPKSERHLEMPVDDVNFLFDFLPQGSQYRPPKHFDMVVLLQGRALMSTTRSKMYLTQPPDTAVSFEDWTSLPLPKESTAWTLWNPMGITFGDLFEIGNSTHSAFRSQDSTGEDTPSFLAVHMEVNLPFCESARQRLLDSCPFWASKGREAGSSSNGRQTPSKAIAGSQESSKTSSGGSADKQDQSQSSCACIRARFDK